MTSAPPPPPSDGTMGGGIGADLNQLGQTCLLLDSPATLRPFTKNPRGPLIKPVHPESLKVCRSMPPMRAASVRFMPSRTAVNDSNRRL